MIPPKFEYYAPTSVEDAVDLLDRFEGEAKVLAGGQSLLPLLKLRLAEPKALIDLNRIPNLAYLREEGDLLKIGALTRTNDLNDSDLIRSRYPIFADAAAVIADPLVRNLGTVGGNVSHGDPANDLPACMIALGAKYIVRGSHGNRTVSADQFYVDTFATALEPNEVLVEIQIPRTKAGQGSAYVKLEKRAGDFPIAGVAVSLVESRGKVEAAGMGLTAVGPTVIRAKEAEGALAGHAPDEATFRHAADLARKAAKPVSDLRGPAEYKASMVAVLARRALQAAHGRAQGGR
ncbi:MAG TPA: xanthine dehydrogenase family protein subunit M [Thermoplasmata archaeon]|nr:xanthine dehydrogenase family protein subunit M [Thermoplasmata archaeon]